MTAFSLALIACCITPIIIEPPANAPVAVRPRTKLSPRQAALYPRLWAGPVDLLASPEIQCDIPVDEFHGLGQRAEGTDGGRPTRVPSSDLASDAAENWAALGFRADDIRHKFGREFDLELAKLKSNLALVDPNANPYVPLRRSGWKTEESVKVPLPGSLFMVGQLQANSGSVEYQQYEFIGRTGVGMRLPSWLGGEIQLRGVRSMANYDPDDESMFPGRTKTFFELATKWPVIGRINLEYTGKAVPGPTARDRDILKQELKLAIPFSDSGQFHIGARYHTEDALVPSPWMERMNMFIGLQMKR